MFSRTHNKRSRRVARALAAIVVVTVVVGTTGAAATESTSVRPSSGGSGTMQTSSTYGYTPRVASSKPASTKIGAGQSKRFLVLKLVEGADVRLQTGKFVSPSGRHDVRRLNSAVGQYGVSAARKFDQSDEALESLRQSGQTKARRILADLRLYFDLDNPDGIATADLANKLNADPLVEIAYPAPAQVPPPALPATPDFSGRQEYATPAPVGIDALAARTVAGGDGTGVRIVDVETSWNFRHEDLNLPASTLIGGYNWSNWPREENIHHGTAVLGQMVALPNGRGVDGLVPGASVAAASPCRTSVCLPYDVAQAILDSTFHLVGFVAGGPRAGVVLIEQQYGPPWESDQTNFVPVETFPADYDSITFATANGFTVVEAAANGNVNLDNVWFGGYVLRRSFRDSGAILVGAGCPRRDTNDATDPDKENCKGELMRQGFSNHGTRVDVQGYGTRVMTTGYGDRFGKPDSAFPPNADPGPNYDPNRLYTDTFSGTSSASPIVASAVASVQGAALSRTSLSLAPFDVRSLLVRTGTPQPETDSARIGPMPDLAKALAEGLGGTQSLTVRGSTVVTKGGRSGCRSAEVLVGVIGTSGSYLDSVTALCQKVSAAGALTGPDMPGTSLGGTGSKSYKRRCPQGAAVVGMSAQAGRWIDSVTLRCRAFAGGTTSGSTMVLAPVVAGSTAPTQGPLTCARSRPVVALGGTYDRFMHSITLTCGM